MHTRANAPSWGRALASAGMKVDAGNHWGMPRIIGQSPLHHVTRCVHTNQWLDSGSQVEGCAWPDDRNLQALMQTVPTLWDVTKLFSVPKRLL